MSLMKAKWIQKDAQSLENGSLGELRVKVDASGAIVRTDNGLNVKDQGIVAAMLASSVAGDGLVGGAGSPLAVNPGDGIDIVSDAVVVDVTDFIDPMAGLTEDAANNIQVKLDANGGLEFNASGAIRLKSAVAGNGLSISDGVLNVNVGNGLTIVSDAVALGTLSANWNVGNNYTITGVPIPTQDSDVASKLYVDTTAQGLIVKDAVRCATTGNITLSGLQTIDGVSVQAGDRVLVKAQTNPVDNGIYIAATGSWTRASDFDGTPTGEVRGGCFTFVQNGVTHADSGWVVVAGGVVDVGTDPINFTQFSGAGQVIAGDGLTKTGNVLDVGAGDGIEVGADTVSVKLDGSSLAKSAAGLKIANNGVTEAHLASSVAGGGLVGGGGSPLAVNPGVGLDIVSDAVVVDVTDFIDTNAGLKEDASNNIQVNLDVNGGLEFNSGAIRLKSSVAGDGLSITNGILSVNVGNGLTIVSDAVALGNLSANWNVGGVYTITNLPTPTASSDAATKGYVDAVAGDINNRIVETFVLTAEDITNKYVSLADSPTIKDDTVLLVAGAPVQYYGDDFIIHATINNRLTWSGLGLDGLLEAGDKLTVIYSV